ncbi:hypothetical protein RQP54_09265 [Curvibacter sp. APW13]|uniref:hypothetical protein n=1 Tax=Curvibacter sp. APW13 TaxID=3077236 RepID=UPI0028DFE3D1|nr:hypothetical protein [Curvibacter sp. APW13]MDT8991051.1 hypothetical protein [Curvibacter sp. APW13]
MPEKKDPPWWLTLLKLLIGLIVIVWGTGALLQWAAQFDSEPPKTGTSDWGIARDSPIPSKR